jgi:hypothetical protein
VFGVSLGFGDLISVELHARWTPDLTISSPPAQCVKSGTVGGGVEFHLKALYSPPVTQFVCDKMVIEEITQDHPPQTIVRTSFNNVSSLGCCSSPPPPGTTQALFCTIPFETYQFHNADYRVTAYYHYIIMRPPPQQPQRVDGNISITVTFQNLTVSSEPKILKWDPEHLADCDTSFSFTLSGVQRKNCRVTINIYSTREKELVYSTHNDYLCPGTYTFTWEPGILTPAGIYTFDIQAVMITPDGQIMPEDKDTFRSGWVTDNIDFGVFLYPLTKYDPHYAEYYLTYHLNHSTTPTEIKGRVYGPSVDNFNIYWEGDGSVVGDYNSLFFPQPVIKVSGWGHYFYAILSGKDGNVNNKSHNHKPFLELGIWSRQPTAALFYSTYSWSYKKDDQGQEQYIAYPDPNAETWMGNDAQTAHDKLLKGVFCLFWGLVKEKATYFSAQWGKRYDMLQPAKSIERALEAIESVDVLSFACHGNGYQIEFADVQQPIVNPSFPVLSTSAAGMGLYVWEGGEWLEIPGQLSNLYLVVIGSCRKILEGQDSATMGFPIVSAIVNKGAKCGIGVGGISHTWKKKGDSPDWNLLGYRTFHEWASRFWKYVTEGEETLEEENLRYPSIFTAAIQAMHEANEVLKPLCSEGDDMQVFIALYGTDGYLGNVNPNIND